MLAAGSVLCSAKCHKKRFAWHRTPLYMQLVARTYTCGTSHHASQQTAFEQGFQRDHLFVQAYDDNDYDAGRPRVHPGAVRRPLSLL